MIDSHAHLLPDFVDNIIELVQNAQNAGVRAIVNSAIEPAHLKPALELEKRFPNYIFTTLGAAPSRIKTMKTKETIQSLREVTSLIAVGEVGLDHYWVHDPSWQDKQKQHFIEYINLANEIKKPIVIHSRKAETDCIDILEENVRVPVLMHCFAGNLEEVKRVIDLGWLISIPTAVIKRKNHRKIARTAPLDNLVVETDTPYLSPIMGQRNEPANVKYAINEIAKLKEITFKEVEKVTTKNALDFYNIKLM
ncbi:MAG: TatD family deoxyribonuclease [Candidatus Heimdallarchaeota archaeon]|nr:TatD family deoxyribonuclease [Candidatus Heimdallarchaeota archaeon]